MPVQDGVLWPTAEAAREAPLGEIDLVFCRDCGYIRNRAYDASLVRFEQGYDISLHYSETYREFIDDLANGLAERSGLRRKRVLEIACGQGDFLKALCSVGPNDGIGIDPALLSEQKLTVGKGHVHLVPERFASSRGTGSADFVCCRHLLQSIPDPLEWVRELRRAIPPDRQPLVYLEVPNASYTFHDRLVWNIGCENCSFYSDSSLARLLVEGGFDVVSTESCFDGQYLGAKGLPAAAGATTGSAPAMTERLDALGRDVDSFAAAYEGARQHWQHEIDRIRSSGKRVAAWGAGTRAITFLNAFDIRDEIPVVVDINPRRQNLYLPRTAQLVTAPESLTEYRPDILLITNAGFQGEIRRQAGELGLRCEFLVLE